MDIGIIQFILVDLFLALSIIEMILRAFGLSIKGIYLAIKATIIRLLPGTRSSKKEERINKRAKKYAKKHNLSVQEVENELRAMLAKQEAYDAKKKEMKEAAKKEKELSKIIK